MVDGSMFNVYRTTCTEIMLTYLIFHFMYSFSIRKPPSSTFPEIPFDKWVTDNVKALRESYLKEYKSKRNFFSAHHHLGSTIKNLFNHKSKSHHGFATSTAADTSSSHQHKTTQPKSFFAHATYASNPVIDVIPEPTTATTSHKETHDNPTGATPIDKLMEQNVIYQKDDNFVVAKEVFETINEKSSKMINDSLNDIRERIENTKTFVTGFMSGGVAVAPVVALQDIVMKFSLSSDAINEFYLDTAFCSFQCALFAMLLRFCIQNDEKDNDFLTNGIVASSALLRTMIMTSNDHFGWQMVSTWTCFCLSQVYFWHHLLNIYSHHPVLDSTFDCRWFGKLCHVYSCGCCIWYVIYFGA